MDINLSGESAFDAYTKEPVAVSGTSVTRHVPPFSYRQIWVR